MKNLLSKIKYAILAIFLMALSCQKEDCLIIDPPEENKLVIELSVNKLYWGETGASGELNGEYKEYGTAEYAVDSNGVYGMAISEFVWYENSTWAAREVIALDNIVELTTVGDTIELVGQEISSTEPLIRLFHMYLDGDAGAECYNIDDSAGSKSWLLINYYNSTNNVIVGELNLSLEISDDCPPKYDPDAPDYITVRNFRFRAKLRE